MNRQGMKQAAVLMASMHPRDRRWVRQRLPSACLPELDRLLVELRKIGGRHPQLLRGALQSEPRPLPAEPPTPDVLLAGLQELDAAWVACALRACAPDHEELYLASQTTAQAMGVREALRTAPSHVPPKLAQVLTRVVRSRGEHALRGAAA